VLMKHLFPRPRHQQQLQLHHPLELLRSDCMTWHVPVCNGHIRFLMSPLVEYHPGINWGTFERDSITAMSLRVVCSAVLVFASGVACLQTSKSCACIQGISWWAVWVL
jgi:hypothetical protein